MPIKFKLKRKKRKRVHGFLRRMSGAGGKRIIRDRRRKKRERLSA